MTQLKNAINRQKTTVLLHTKEKEKEKENEKERDKKKKEKEAADAVSGGATQQDRQDVFAQFAGEDSALLQALQDYDLMRQEKHKELTDTMRRSLCRQLDEEFHRCEWVEIVKQATMRGVDAVLSTGRTEAPSEPAKATDSRRGIHSLV